MSSRPTAPTASRDLSRPLPASLSWIVLAAFGAALIGASLWGLAPWWIAGAYAAMSVVTFVVYAIDKAVAGGARRRVPEQTLLLLGLLCGWPGALVAQQTLRHKTRKRAFRRPFWGTVVVNVLACGALIAVAAVNGWALTLPI